MNSFQILDKEGKAISLKTLDEEAAAFWNKKVNSKHYANPIPDIVVPEDATDSEKIKASMHNAQNNSCNWFDTIGWNIANQRANHMNGWANVIGTMAAESLGECLLHLEDSKVRLVEFRPLIRYDKDGNEIPCQEIEPDAEMAIYMTLEYYKPFVALINHWASKGYQPKQIKE